jgi:hypothetical protein
MNESRKQYLLKKFREESTWRGAIAIIASFGIILEPEQANSIVALGLFAIGLINACKDQKPSV